MSTSDSFGHATEETASSALLPGLVTYWPSVKGAGRYGAGHVADVGRMLA